jgi:hypothetical protein
MYDGAWRVQSRCSVTVAFSAHESYGELLTVSWWFLLEELGPSSDSTRCGADPRGERAGGQRS